MKHIAPDFSQVSLIDLKRHFAYHTDMPSFLVRKNVVFILTYFVLIEVK